MPPTRIIQDEAEPPVMCEHVHDASDFLGDIGCGRVATCCVVDGTNGQNINRAYCDEHGPIIPHRPKRTPERTIMEELQAKIAEELDKKIMGLNRPGHPGFMAILEELKATHVRKSQDYGNDADPFANIRSAEQIGIEPWLAAWVRARDKVHRIDEFCRKRALANEGIEDGWLDLASYCVIALHFWRESHKKGTS